MDFKPIKIKLKVCCSATKCSNSTEGYAFFSGFTITHSGEANPKLSAGLPKDWYQSPETGLFLCPDHNPIY